MIMKTSHTIYTSFAKRLAVVLMVLMTIGIGNMLAEQYTYVFSTTNNWYTTSNKTTKVGTGDSNNYTAIYYSDNTEWTASGTSHYFNSGYYLLGKSGACLNVPTFNDEKITSIQIFNSSGCSQNVSVAIISGNQTAANAQTWSTKSSNYTYSISSNYQSSSLAIKVSNAYNAQITKVIINTESVAPACSYTVTFNSNYGTNTTSSQEFTCGETKALAANSFSRTGYTFAGWATSANGSVAYTDQQLVSLSSTNNDNIPLFAQWTPTQYTITYTSLEGATHNNPTKYTIESETITFTAPSERVGYKFTGWNPASITKGSTGNKTITAQWKAKDLTNYRTTCSTKADPNLSWSASTCIATMEVDNEFPTLTNPYELSITYLSSDPTVATIDENGTITLLKSGTTTITASYEEDEDYLSASTSYELTVEAANCKWVETEIGDIESGDEVVIAMEKKGDINVLTYALADNNTAAKEAPLATEISINANKTINTDITPISTPLIWNIDYDKEGTKNLVIYSTRNVGKWLYSNDANDGVRIGDNTNKEFKIVKGIGDDAENSFLYHVAQNRYLGVYYTENDWRGYTLTDKGAFPNNIKGQTLKFYKKECIASDEYWIIYNLENVTCNSEMPNYIGTDGEIELYFSANSGYKLPEQVSITMGGLPLSEDAFAWEAEQGLLYIIPDGEITGNLVITIEGCELLALPTNLKATNITSSSARLTWDEIEHAEQYQVHVTDDDDSTEDIITTTSSTYFEITGLKSASPYLWGVTPIASGYCGITQEAEYFETLDVYTVTFNSNGGTAVEPQTVDAGSKITAPANPSAAGYTFNYWYTTDANVPFDFNTPITGNTTLNAKWTPNVYTITFYKQSGIGGTDNATVTFNSNNYSVSTIEAPTREKYAFGGYYTEQHGAGVQVVDADGNWLKNVAGYTDANGNWIKAENTHLYAKWTAIYTITWVVNNNTETPYHTSTVLSGSTIDQLPTPPADDLFADCDVNAFVGWSTDNIGLEPDATAPTDLFKTPSEAQSKIGAINGDKKFYAVYASEIEQIATFEADGLNGLSANSTLKWTHDNSGISLAISEGQRYTGSPKTFTITNGTSNYCEIVAPEGKSLKKAVVSITGSNYKVNSVSSPWSLSTTSSTTQTITTSTNATDLKMYATSSYQIRITQVDVTYTTYSNYITRCTALPDPVWGGATIDKTEIAVNCGETSSTNGAARISFPKETNYNLYKDITVEVTSGHFIIASSRDGEYTTSVTLSPTQNGENVGTFANKYVYVRAVAPPMSSNQLTGTITISGKQITTQVINVTATVTCNEYTLTFNDCGDTKTITDFAGTSVEEMEPWAETCSEPFQYVFDGWATAPVANGTEEYEKVDFSTFTMPNNNTTILYAVYRYAEEGGEPVNGYVKVTEALTDWSGDYVIVDDKFNVAIQNTYEEDTKDNKTLKDVSVTIENDKIVSPTNDIIWTISKSGEYYTMYNTEAIKYAGITKNETRAAGLSETIATGYSMNIIFDSNTKIAKVSSTNYNRCFSYSESYPEWRTYSNNDANGKTGYLYRLSNKTIRYTSSLVCGTIEAEDALVTSTKDQKVKVKVPITLESSTGVTTINATSDNAAFDVTGLTDVEAGDHTIVVEYTPAEYNITETANITLSATNGATATFTVSGRSLPENFVIATKVGATWYALPANMNGATNPEGVVIDVDETTMTATAPNTTVYTLFPVATVNGGSDRYKEYGERLRFAAVNNDYKGLWANDAKSGTTINNDAKITAANSTAGAAYEWKITTTIVDGNWQYTLQTDQDKNQQYLRYWVGATGAPKWGTYASGNEKLYFLPVTTYTDLDLEVMEWGTNSMVIRAGEDLPQNVNITINGTTTSKTLQNINGSDLHKIDDVTLTSDDCGTIIIDNGSNARKIIRKPLLVSSNKSGSEYTTSPGRDICAECDIVILNGGKLIADEAKSTGSHVDFANIYVYPGGKLVLDGNSLGVKRQVYLRGGYSWINQTTYDLPEVYVNGDINFNGSGNIIYDYYIQNYKYYQFSLPYQVPLTKVTDEAGVDNFPVWVKHYNGALRAANANATSWEWYSGENFEVGIGYIIAAKPRQEGKVANRPLSIIRFPLGNSVISSAEADKSIATTAHGIDAYNAGTITANNVGWNFIGNPFMATWKGDIGHQQLMKSPDAEHWNGSYHWENNDVKYITVMSPEDGTDYDQYIAANTELKPFFPFYLQETADGDAGTINFAAANRIQKAPAELYADEPREAFVQVEILTDRVEDQTGVFISDTYSDDIDFDDYEKIFGSSLEKSKLWFMHENKRMAFEAMTEASAAANIALGYRAPKTGTYTFAINEDVSALNEVMGVYLTDHELGVTDYNLLYNTYEFETKATNYNDQRFTIRIALRDDSNGVVTGVDNIGTMNDGMYKFIYQDKMYIYNDGIIYDATGKQVTNINK